MCWSATASRRLGAERWTPAYSVDYLLWKLPSRTSIGRADDGKWVAGAGAVRVTTGTLPDAIGWVAVELLKAGWVLSRETNRLAD